MLFLSNAGWVLVGASFVTSMLTAVVGMGGGVLLLALMPGLIPATAIIPVHGAVQLVSNSTRAGFSRRNINWQILRRYIPGAIVGTFFGSLVFQAMNPNYVPVVMGTAILLITWIPVKYLGFLLKHYLPFGVVHSLLSTIGGAAGPMGGAYLVRANLPRDTLVTTLAAMMTASHAMKVVAFGLIGFSFAEFWPLILSMMVSVTAGSFVGTRLRGKIPESVFKKWFKYFITLLAVRMLLMPVFGA